MCPSLHALCVGLCRLFVLVFAADHAEQHEADQRCQKAQADQCGRGRRSRGEIKDGHHHRKREDDFQKVGHWMGRFVVSTGVQNGTGAPVALFTRWAVYSFTRQLVYRFARPPVYLFTNLPVHAAHILPRTAGRIMANSSTTRERSKPSRMTARMVSSPAIVPQRLSGLWASISVVMLVA